MTPVIGPTNAIWNDSNSLRAACMVSVVSVGIRHSPILRRAAPRPSVTKKSALIAHHRAAARHEQAARDEEPARAREATA
jgi:hypothetical protein